MRYHYWLKQDLQASQSKIKRASKHSFFRDLSLFMYKEVTWLILQLVNRLDLDTRLALLDTWLASEIGQCNADDHSQSRHDIGLGLYLLLDYQVINHCRQVGYYHHGFVANVYLKTRTKWVWCLSCQQYLTFLFCYKFDITSLPFLSAGFALGELCREGLTQGIHVPLRLWL